MKSYKTYKIEDKYFRTKLIIATGDWNKFSKDIGYTYPITKNVGAIAFQHNGVGYIFLFEKSRSHLLHELIHICLDILDSRVALTKIDGYADQEIVCYGFDFYLKEIRKTKLRKQLKW